VRGAEVLFPLDPHIIRYLPVSVKLFNKVNFLIFIKMKPLNKKR